MTLAPDEINLSTLTGPKLTLTCLLGASGARVSEGYGGWTVTARPRAAGMTFWEGKNPFQVTANIVIDGFVNEESVEDKCFRLERMALPPQPHQDPPVIDIDGVQFPKTTLKWVIENLEWTDDGLERDDHGNRIRQSATVTFRQYVTDSRLKASKRKKKPKTTTQQMRDRHAQFLGR